MTEVVINGKHVRTPELDRRKAIIDSGASAVVQEFFDWLRREGVIFAKAGSEYEVVLCRRIYGRRPDDREPMERYEPEWRTWPYEADLLGHAYAACNPDGSMRGEDEAPIVEVRVHEDDLGHHPLQWRSGEEVLAEFFEIDLTKIDAEQRALLDALREAA